MGTINRNSRRAKAILASATNCKVYDLDSYFEGKVCPPDCVAYDMQRLPFTKLRDTGEGKFTATVHSNLWYTFESDQ